MTDGHMQCISSTAFEYTQSLVAASLQLPSTVAYSLRVAQGSPVWMEHAAAIDVPGMEAAGISLDDFVYYHCRVRDLCHKQPHTCLTPNRSKLCFHQQSWLVLSADFFWLILKSFAPSWLLPLASLHHGHGWTSCIHNWQHMHQRTAACIVLPICDAAVMTVFVQATCH